MIRAQRTPLTSLEAIFKSFGFWALGLEVLGFRGFSRVLGFGALGVEV